MHVSTQVRQSEDSGYKSRSGQMAYFHGVKTRLSTLGTGDVLRGSDSTFWGHKRTTGEAGIATTSVFRELDWELQWKLRTLDKPFGFLVIKPSGVRFAEVSLRNHLVNWAYMAGIGIMIRFISGGLEYWRSGFRWQSS